MKESTSPSSAEVKKPIVSPELAAKAMSLRQMYLSLSKLEQEAVTHFFNLHNNAGWIYNELMSDDGRKYIDDQVYYSQELAALEKSSEDDFEHVDKLNELLDEMTYGKDGL